MKIIFAHTAHSLGVMTENVNKCISGNEVLLSASKTLHSESSFANGLTICQISMKSVFSQIPCKHNRQTS